MLIDCHNHLGIELVSYLTGVFPYGQHLQTMVTDGRELGVRRWIVFPMVSHIALDFDSMRKGKMQPGGLEDVPYAFENRRMLQEINELFSDEGKDTIPFAMFDPARNIAGQEKALRQLREEYSFFGLKTQPTILQAPITNLHKEARVFLALAQEWDIPVLIHSSVIENDIWSQASDILDVAETAPNVRFCVAHSLRFDRAQLDRLNAMPNCWFDCSAHRIHCDLAVQDNPIVAPPERRFDSDYTRPAQVLRDLAQAYPNKLMWGSDSPYYSYVGMHDGITIKLLSTYAQEVSVVHALPLELQREIGETNTLNCLKLKD